MTSQVAALVHDLTTPPRGTMVECQRCLGSFDVSECVTGIKDCHTAHTCLVCSVIVKNEEVFEAITCVVGNMSLIRGQKLVSCMGPEDGRRSERCPELKTPPIQLPIALSKDGLTLNTGGGKMKKGRFLCVACQGLH